MKRFLIAALMLLASAPAFAQKTPAPFVLQAYYNDNGNPYDSAGICVFSAGTSTQASSYTTAGGSVTNANPLMLDSAGRPTSNGFFLTPGAAYKLVFVNFTGVSVPACSPINGVTVWTQDNIEAIPGSGANVDITGTVGQTITAGQVVYLSDGSGSLNQGQWYLADADLTYAGVLPWIGMAPNAITSGQQGTIRLQGQIEGLSGLSTGGDYYVSGTAGALTGTPPGYARLVGQADSATTIVIGPNPRQTPVSPRAPCGRLTLTTAVPVTTADVTAATSVFYTPYGGCNSISLFDGLTRWAQRTFTEVSIAVPATTGQMYDIFGYDNAGTFTLELLAWTNDTTRATALTTQNGVLVKTGATTRLYLGSFRTTTVSGQTEDSFAKRYLWNYYNRAARSMRVTDATNSWTYDNGSYRQANGAAANQIDCVIGVAEVQISVEVIGLASHNAAAGASPGVAIGEDSTTTGVANQLMARPTIGDASQLYALRAALVKYPAVGRHFYVWLESGAGATTTWYGDNNAPTLYQAGIQGTIWG